MQATDNGSHVVYREKPVVWSQNTSQTYEIKLNEAILHGTVGGECMFL